MKPGMHAAQPRIQPLRRTPCEQQVGSRAQTGNPQRQAPYDLDAKQQQRGELNANPGTTEREPQDGAGDQRPDDKGREHKRGQGTLSRPSDLPPFSAAELSVEVPSGSWSI